MLLWSLACAPATIELPAKDNVVDDTGLPDSGDSDTDESGDSGETGETGDSGETGETGDSQDTAPDPAVDDFTLTVDGDVVTVLHATWTDPGATDAWVEYRFETEEWLRAPLVDAASAVLLGIPAETPVEARAALVVDGDTIYSNTATTATGSLPRDLLVPSIDAYDPAIAYDADYAMISIAAGDYTYSGPYWIEIFDRQGRIVWYRETPDNMFTFYPTVSWDGTHIWFEGSDIFGLGTDDPYVQRMTLDGRWSTRMDVPGMGQAIGEGPDGSFFFERRSRDSARLDQLDASGNVTPIWDCGAWMAERGHRSSECEMNTTNWSEAHNSVIASMFIANTAFEIDLASGEPIRQMGQLTVGEPYSFDPAESMFDYQHNVYWTDAGTILASTHVQRRSGVQVAAEYEVDDETMTLTRVWSYVSTDMWATQVGEAIRLPNGNTTQGYGQDGGVREVTTDGQIAWQATWEKDDYGYRVVGHCTLIPDLYALNVGWE